MNNVLNKSEFMDMMESFYDATECAVQYNKNADISIKMSSISGSMDISIYLNGYISGIKPDYIYHIDEESSKPDVFRAKEMLKYCKEVKEIFLNNG